MAKSILYSLWIDRLAMIMIQINAPMAEDTLLDKLADTGNRIFSTFDHGVSILHDPCKSVNADTDMWHIRKIVDRLAEADARNATYSEEEIKRQISISRQQSVQMQP